MSKVVLHEGDNRIALRRMIDAGVRVHSVITDPPYGLTSVTKRFGGTEAAPAKFGTDGAFGRVSAGFMGSQWDGTGIERDPEFWKLIYDVLLPGGYVAAFSSPRTGHWQGCAMELAGFTMHPFNIWAYGQGMPKAHNAAMAIDKHFGVAGGRGAPKTETYKGLIGRKARSQGETHEGYLRPWMDNPEAVENQARQYIPGSDEALKWDGFAYGAQALKPALEPIYIGQKPFSEKNGPLNLIKHGVGAINIAACRVHANDVAEPRRRHGGGIVGAPSPYEFKDSNGLSPVGRHPANLMHDNSDEVVRMFPTTDNAETQSAARFFNNFPLDIDPMFYHAKASKSDRAGSRHPTVKPVPLIRWLARCYTPPGGTILDPFAGSGTTGQAALDEGFDVVLCEAEAQFISDIRRRFNLPQVLFSADLEALIGGSDQNLIG